MQQPIRAVKLDLPDQCHLDAAQGWLGLGDWREANGELENITPQNRAHPEVLLARWEIYCRVEKWALAYQVAQAIDQLLPDSSVGVIQMAIALHKMQRTSEAWQLLTSVVDKFPDNHLMRYNLACYSCRLGKLKEAFGWIEKAIDLAGKTDVRQIALDDPELEPIWVKIGEI